MKSSRALTEWVYSYAKPSMPPDTARPLPWVSFYAKPSTPPDIARPLPWVYFYAKPSMPPDTTLRLLALSIHIRGNKQHQSTSVTTININRQAVTTINISQQYLMLAGRLAGSFLET